MSEKPSASKNTPLQIALAFAIACVPIVTAWIAARYADIASDRQTKAQLVSLAVSILREPPRPKTVDVREWSMDLLDKYSDVKLPAKARKALNDSVRFPTEIAPPPVTFPGGEAPTLDV